jgi:hypothetical protein
MGKRGPLPKHSLPVADCPVNPAPKMTKEAEARERRWKAEDALRTCEQYAKISKDKNLMKDVKALAAEKMNELKQVANK